MSEATETAILAMGITIILLKVIVDLSIKLDSLRKALIDWRVERTMIGNAVYEVSDTVERFRRGEICRKEFLIMMDCDIDQVRTRLKVMGALPPKKNPGEGAGV